jgi:hypothetical protein
MEENPDPGYGILVLDEKNSNPGSGVKHPDPQHWYNYRTSLLETARLRQ